MLPENYYLNGLRLLPGLGSIRIQELLAHFEFSPSLAWQGIKENDLPCSADFAQHLIREQKKIDLEEEWNQLQQEDYHFCSILDDAYPSLLKQIPDPPIFLFYKGMLPTQPAITIVGSRRMSAYGQQVLEFLLSSLKGSTLSIISGLAYGVDKEAHELALRNHLPTTAVLGSGIHSIQPSQHELLAQSIVEEGGCLLSEFEADMKAQKGTFPRRNRILAGLSPITLVVEAAKKSGALITARFAAEYNREIGVIPGSIFSDVSAGCHYLLHQGAIPITSPEDLLKLLELPSMEQTSLFNDLSEKEKNILAMIGNETRSIDELAKAYSGRSADLFSTITSLELKRMIKHLPGQGYRKSY